MPSTPTRSRRPDNLDPVLIRQVRLIGWIWTVVFLAAAVIVQGISVQLKNPAWLVLPGGRSAAASVHAFLPVHLLLVSWGAFLIFIVSALVIRELTRPSRAWPMLVLMVLGVAAAAFFGSAATSAILQLGHNALSESAASAQLLGPAQNVSTVATIAAVLTLIVLPGVLAAIRGARKPSTAKEPT